MTSYFCICKFRHANGQFTLAVLDASLDTISSAVLRSFQIARVNYRLFRARVARTRVAHCSTCTDTHISSNWIAGLKLQPNVYSS